MGELNFLKTYCITWIRCEGHNPMQEKTCLHHTQLPLILQKINKRKNPKKNSQKFPKTISLNKNHSVSFKSISPFLFMSHAVCWYQFCLTQKCFFGSSERRNANVKVRSEKITVKEFLCVLLMGFRMSHEIVLHSWLVTVFKGNFQEFIM